MPNYYAPVGLDDEKHSLPQRYRRRIVAERDASPKEEHRYNEPRKDPPGHEDRIRQHAERVEREEPAHEREISESRQQALGYTRRQCAIDGCQGAASTNGLCGRCYNRERKRRVTAKKRQDCERMAAVRECKAKAS